MNYKHILNTHSFFYCIFTPHDTSCSDGFKEFIIQFDSAGQTSDTINRRNLVKNYISRENGKIGAKGTLYMIPVTGRPAFKRFRDVEICSGAISGAQGVLAFDFTKSDDAELIDLPASIAEGEQIPYVQYINIKDDEF